MFLNFTDVKGGVHEACSTSWNGLMARSGLEPNFMRVDLCCEVRLGLLICVGKIRRGSWVCLRNSVKLVEFG